MSTPRKKQKKRPTAKNPRRLLGALAFFGLRFTPWRLRWALARLLGRTAMLLPYRAYVSLTNLDLAFGNTMSEAEKRRVSRQSIASFLGCMFDAVALIPRLTEDTWAQHVQVPEEDLVRTRKYLAEGKGVLVMFAHYGNWELMGAAMAYMDLAPINVVAKKQVSWANMYIESLRTRTGNQVIYKEGAVRRTLTALKRGEIVGLAIDQNFSRGIFVPFFGVPAGTPDTLAALARASGAPIVPLTCVPNGDGTYTGRLLPAVRARQSEDKAQDVFDTTRDCLAALEELIRQTPRLWLWGHKRWKSRPPGETSPKVVYNKTLHPRNPQGTP